MKLPRIYLIAIFIFVFIVGATAQEPPKAVLVDEYGPIGCEDVSGRLDNFLNELRINPDSTGYIVISTNPTFASRLAWQGRFIDGYARYRNFDETRFVIVRSSLQEPIQVQMWRVPADLRFPVATEVESKYELDKSTRKLRLYSDFDDSGPCYTGPPLRLLSKYLKANPEYLSNIAIGSPSTASFRKAKDGIMQSFQKDYGVELSRLRFFWIRTHHDPEIYELWLIGKKPK